MGFKTDSPVPPMVDGLFVRGGAPLRAKAATWKVVVVLETNLDSTALCHQIGLLERVVMKTYLDGISLPAKVDWIDRKKKTHCSQP